MIKNIWSSKFFGQKSTWKGVYLGNSIEIHNSWFNGKVRVNNEVQKVRYGWFGKSALECELPNKNSQTKIEMRLVAGLWKVKCFLFADGH